MAYLGTKPNVATSLQDNIVTSDKIADGVISTADLADNAVTTAKIAPGAVIQADLAIGVAGTGPAFRAFLGSDQTVSNTVDTKVTLTNEIFDTASRFNNTGSTVNGIPPYAFLPNVAGYYQINASIGASASASLTYNYIQIRKNGTIDIIAIYPPYLSVVQYGSVSVLTYLNGTTDYVELFVQLAGSGTLTALVGSIVTSMSGSLVRAA